MVATIKRIFIGNLPCDISEADVRERFSKFGKVFKIESKNSNNFAQSSRYAFLDIQIDTRLLSTCFNSLSKDNWNGHSIKVELAKESFLSRLEKERQQESSTITSPAADHEDNDLNKAKLDKRSRPTISGKTRKLGTKESSNTSQATKHKDDDLNKCKLDKQMAIAGKKRKFLSDDDSHSNEEIDIGTHQISSDIVTVGKNIKQSSIEIPLEKGLLQKFESFSDVWKDLVPTSNTNLPKRTKYDYDAECGFEIVPQNKKDPSKVDSMSALQEKSTRKGRPTKSVASDEKRLKSIAARQMSFLQQKEAVALALASVDSNIKTNKKIIFDDDGINKEITPTNGEEKSSVQLRKVPQGPRLFEEEAIGEEEQNYDFNIRRQFEGRKGQKLLDLQSRYADDKRFALDDRFYESDGNDDSDDATNAAKEGSIEEEKRKQIEILQSIVGSNLPLTPEERKGKQANVDSMVVHYDPTRDDHAKYERDIPKKVVVTPKQKKIDEKKAKKKKELPALQVPSVSKEKFYKVSESLKESLKTSDAKGFSLLATFGSIDTEGLTTGNEDEYSCISTTKRKSTHHTPNPFKYDSSESEDDADDTPAKQTIPPSLQQQQQQQSVQVQGIWQQSFFFKPNDDRLSEGVKFFSEAEPSNEDFQTRRRVVKQIVSAKVRHNLRISASRGRTRGGRRRK